MNPSHQTTHVNIHAGPHAGRLRPGKALIDTGSPLSFVSCSFFESMLAHTGKNIRLNVQCFGAFWVATVQLAVNAYIVPDGAMAHESL